MSSSTQVVITSQPTAAPRPVPAVVPATASQTNPLLAKYLVQLATHPLRTKSITLGTLQLIQEILASHLAGVPAKRVPKDAPLYQHILAKAKIDSKAVKMAAYGAFVSAPLGHYLVGLLQRAFAGRTSTRDKILQIVASNLLVSPVQISGFLISMAVINGAKSVHEVARFWRAHFLSTMRLVWTTSPLALVIAQRYLSPDLWVPWFNFVQFVAGTYFNTKGKKALMAKKREEEKRE